MQEDPRETVQRLASLAGVPLSDERVAALALVLPAVLPAIAALAAVDYGETEPAGRFRPRADVRG